MRLYSHSCDVMIFCSACALFTQLHYFEKRFVLETQQVRYHLSFKLKLNITRTQRRVERIPFDQALLTKRKKQKQKLLKKKQKYSLPCFHSLI